jgi:predicted phosphodiesterase
MKIAICSDLHLEFETIVLENTEGAEVLILSGDILVERDLDMYDRRQVELGFMNKRSLRFHEFFQDVSNKFPHVVYVAGNHEHYHGDFKYTTTELKRKLAYLPNVYVLDRDLKDINGVKFIGSTLWTDMNNGDQLTLYHMRSMMNDFQCVANSNREVNYKVQDLLSEVPDKMIFKTRPAKFCPEDAFEEHIKCKQYIQVCTAFLGEDTNKYVVVGHHAPSRRSTHPRYQNDTIMNGGYSSSLDEFIMDRPNIKLWTHGHTHEPFDYMIGETRIVCNPRGYANYEHRAAEFELKFVEI